MKKILFCLLLFGTTLYAQRVTVDSIYLKKQGLTPGKWISTNTDLGGTDQPYDSLNLNNNTGSNHSIGTLYRNGGVLNFRMGFDGVTQQIGQELYSATVKNTTGGTLLNGRVVRIAGHQGNKPTVKYASYSSLDSIDGLVGVLTMDIANNDTGIVTTAGLVHDLNTSAYTSGDTLWLSHSGQVQKTKPTTGIPYQIGYCDYSHSQHGIIYVKLEKTNDIRTTTRTNLTGYLYGNGSEISSNLGYTVGSSSIGFVAYNGRVAAKGKFSGGEAAITSSDSILSYSGGIYTNGGAIHGIYSRTASGRALYGTSISSYGLYAQSSSGVGGSIGSGTGVGLQINNVTGNTSNIFEAQVNSSNKATIDYTGKLTCTFIALGTNSTVGQHVYSTNSSTGDGYYVYNTAGGNGFKADNNSTGNGGLFQNLSSGNGIKVSNTPNATGNALYINNTVSTSTGNLLFIENASAAIPLKINLNATGTNSNVNYALYYKNSLKSKIDSTGKAFHTGAEIGTTNDNTTIATDGQVTLNGKAKAWNDVAIMGFALGTASAAPVFTTGWAGSSAIGANYFQGTVQNDIAYFNIQIPHNCSPNDSIRVHIHAGPTTTPVSTDTVVFRFTYSYAEIGSVFPSVTQVTTKIPLGSQSQWGHYLTNLFLSTTGTGNAVSGTYNCSIERLQDNTSDTYTGNYGVLSIDCHAKINSFGSRYFNAK